MSSSTNSVNPYVGASLAEMQESLGITQFPGEYTWYQIIGGLVIQGGFEIFTGAATRTVNLVAPFQKQVLNITISPTSAGDGPHGHIVAGPGLTSFQIKHYGPNASYFWLAIGV